MNALSTDSVSFARITIPLSEMLFSLVGILTDLWKLVNKIPKLDCENYLLTITSWKVVWRNKNEQ